jgi:hypothetical protein
MDVRTVSLLANTPVRFRVPHRFFMLTRTSAALEVRKLAPNTLSQVGEIGRDVEAPYKYFPLNPSDESERWGGFELLSTVAQDVRIAVSDSAGDYARFGTLVELDPGATLQTVADVTAIGAGANVSLVAANATRRAVHITSLAANTTNLRIGDTNTTTTRGLQLAPGMTLTLNTRAQVFGRSESGTCSVSVLEELA